MLALLGLDACAEGVYRSMLAHPEHGVKDLARALDRPEQEIRSALDRLSGMTLLQPSLIEGEGMRAVRPDVGMEILLARQQAELASQQQRIERSRSAAAKLIAEYADLETTEARTDVEQLVGIDRIRGRLAELTESVQHEVLTFAPNGAHTPESLQAAQPLDQELLRRGVRLHTVYLDSVRNSLHTVAYAEWLAALGGQVRTAPSLPVRLIIVDRRVAVIPAKADNARQSAVVLRGQGTLTALCALFDSTWSTATRLGATRRPDGAGLSPQEREVLGLLYRGLTDDAIAKRLGVSSRTARRIASDMMDRLDARSRFQAGALAVQHGWLPAQT